MMMILGENSVWLHWMALKVVKVAINRRGKNLPELSTQFTTLGQFCQIFYIRIVCRGWTHFHFLCLNHCGPLSLSIIRIVCRGWTPRATVCTLLRLSSPSPWKISVSNSSIFLLFFGFFSVQIFLFIDPELATLLWHFIRNLRLFSE